MFVEEVFVEVTDFPNYAVSNYGSVVNVKTERELKGWDCDGKMMVKLYCVGIAENYFIHRLVAQAFFVDYDEEVDVYHISKDKHDNCVTNLHLVSRYK